MAVTILVQILKVVPEAPDLALFSNLVVRAGMAFCEASARDCGRAGMPAAPGRPALRP
jgi:hypothetical protein